MPIRALSFHDCDRFNAARAAVARHTDTAVEWFVDDTGTVLGAVAYHHRALDWSFLVLQRTTHGGFRALDGDAGLCALDEARCELMKRMARAVAASDHQWLPRPVA
jgi:hypothetical protein